MSALDACPATMSSREIADLCGKKHSNVLRDIRAMFQELHPVSTGTKFGSSADTASKFGPSADTELKFEFSDDAACKFAHTYVDPSGRTLLEYRLPKRETLILVSGYRLLLRARIIDRWEELEAQRLQPPPPAELLDHGVDLRDAISLVREARQLGGRAAARDMWHRLGLPALLQPRPLASLALPPTDEDAGFGAWFADRIAPTTPNVRIRAAALYRDYEAWCRRHDYTALSVRAFGAHLTSRRATRLKDSAGNIAYAGLALT